MQALTFKGGIHPPDNKYITNKIPIRELPAPKQMVYLMSQHIGAPCKPCVSVGDQVCIGQMIGEAPSLVSAHVHSSVSGTVTAIEPRMHPTGVLTPAIIVENDENDTVDPSIAPYGPYRDLKPSSIVDIVRSAGIVGMGGAAFPTHVKLSPPPSKIIHDVIINGAECEPYLTSDHRVMLENAKEVIGGLKIILWNFRLRTGYIAVEENKPDAIEALNKAIEEEKGLVIKVVTLKTKYPQGGEKQLIKAVLGKSVPPGKLPMDIGVVVNNIDTATAIYRAVKFGMPLISRIVTVSGDCVKEPANFRVRTGTPFSYIFEQAGGFVKEPVKILAGGPMMGIAIPSVDIPVIKSTSALLAFSAEATESNREHPCLRCGKCVEACPMNLMPVSLNLYAQINDFEQLSNLHIQDCVECGACSYLCPSGQHPVQSIKIAKQKMAKQS